MPADEIQQWLKQVPFRPFILHVLETSRFEIRLAETCIVKLIALDLYERTAGPDVEFHRTMTIALRHVTRLEVIAPAPA